MIYGSDLSQHSESKYMMDISSLKEKEESFLDQKADHEGAIAQISGRKLLRRVPSQGGAMFQYVTNTKTPFQGLGLLFQGGFSHNWGLDGITHRLYHRIANYLHAAIRTRASN